MDSLALLVGLLLLLRILGSLSLRLHVGLGLLHAYLLREVLVHRPEALTEGIEMDVSLVGFAVVEHLHILHDAALGEYRLLVVRKGMAEHLVASCEFVLEG